MQIPHFQQNYFTVQYFRNAAGSVEMRMSENAPDFEINNNEAKKISFPYKITEVDPELNIQLMKDFTGERTGFVQVGSQKWFFPSKYKQEAENYYNFEVRPDDVWVITYPRSGTTWTQELVWMIANDLNYEKAARIPLTERFPFLEFSMCVHPETKAEFLQENNFCSIRKSMVDAIDKPGWRILQECTERRFIKTHIPFSLLPQHLLNVGCKIIYVARNPKDVAVSFFHLNRLIRTQGYVGDFPKYWDYFERNLHHWTPYWKHIQEGWERRNEKNVLFMFYEDMNKNLSQAVEKVATFLSKSLTKEQIAKLEDYLKIENFRNNKSVNYDQLKILGILNDGEQAFVRQGKTGTWKGEFTKELNDRADRWIQENLKQTNLRFPQ